MTSGGDRVDHVEAHRRAPMCLATAGAASAETADIVPEEQNGPRHP